MRTALSFLVVAAMLVTLPAVADEAGPATGPSSVGAVVAPPSAHTLAQVHGGLTADADRVAGRSRDIEMTTSKPAAPKVRPTPTPRVLRRMSPERTVAAVDPAVRACSAQSPVAAPTTFGLRVTVAPGGEVEGVEPSSSVRLPPALLACVVSAVSTARFGAPGANGASIVVPITVPGRAAMAAPSDGTTVTVMAPASPPAAEKTQEVVASKP